MKRLKFILLAVIVFGSINYSSAQTRVPTLTIGEAFWFGAKIGSGFVLNEYWDKDYKDFYNFSSRPTYNIGLVFNYSASNTYGIYTELQFAQTFRKLTNDPNVEDGIDVESEATFNYISAPALMRFKLQIDPRWHVFTGIGPQISYWLSGNTTITSSEFREFGSFDNLNYTYGINKTADDIQGEENVMALPKANRFQYGLMLMVGTMFDVKEYQRISVDARLLWAHSFFGFNEDVTNVLSEYAENFRFRQHVLSFNLSYTFGYDPIVARKGQSTIKRKKRKKTF